MKHVQIYIRTSSYRRETAQSYYLKKLHMQILG